MRWIAGLLAAGLLGGSLYADEADRNGTRLEMGERYCRGHVECLRRVREDVRLGRTVQQVVATMGAAIYRDNPANAERAYEAMASSLRFAHDFITDAEMTVGQSRFVGAEIETLREMLQKYSSDDCTAPAINWLARYQCVMRRIRALLPQRT